MKKEVVGDHDQRSGGEVGVGASAPVSADLKLPWRVGFDDGGGRGEDGEGAWIVADDGRGDTIVCGGKDDWGCKVGVFKLEHAALIVRAVNSHADMLAALRVFLNNDPRFQIAIGGNPQAVDKMVAGLNALLARAEGRTS